MLLLKLTVIQKKKKFSVQKKNYSVQLRRQKTSPIHLWVSRKFFLLTAVSTEKRCQWASIQPSLSAGRNLTGIWSKKPPLSQCRKLFLFLCSPVLLFGASCSCRQVWRLVKSQEKRTFLLSFSMIKGLK